MIGDEVHYVKSCSLKVIGGSEGGIAALNDDWRLLQPSLGRLTLGSQRGNQRGVAGWSASVPSLMPD